MVLLILAALIALSIVLDLDILLGAFTAGIVWRLIMRDAAEADREAVESKVEAVAFGFLVPIFFIYTGVTFDLEALLAQPILFLLLPVVARRDCSSSAASPSMLAAPEGATRKDRLSHRAARSDGAADHRRRHRDRRRRGDPLDRVARRCSSVPGMLSVLLFPLIAMSIRGERRVGAAAPLEDDLA